ncbi:unnamed protein product, partial [Rotaria socialis]
MQTIKVRVVGLLKNTVPYSQAKILFEPEIHEQSNAKGEVQDPESGLGTGTQDTDINSSQPNEGIDSNNSAQNTQLPQIEDIGSDGHKSNDDDNFVFSRKAYQALLKDRAQLEALKNQLKNEATAQNDQSSNIKDLVNNSLNKTTDNDSNIPDNDNGTVGTNNNVQSTSNAQHGTVQQPPQVNIDTSVRPRTYASVVTLQSTNNVQPTPTVIQTPMLNQTLPTVQSQTFHSQLPQNYSMTPHNFNQTFTANPQVYYINNPVKPELPYFKGNKLDNFNKYLILFEKHCLKHYGNDREQWPMLLINKLNKEIKATLPPEAEYDWTYEKIICNIQDYLNLIGDKQESSVMSKFWRLAKFPNESPTMFSVRLLQAFKEAFPQDEFTYTKNTSLRERFVDAQAEDTKVYINDNTLIHTSTGQQLPYETYVNLAERYESEIKPRQQRFEKMQQNQQPKYYPNQFKTVNQNKICKDIDLNNSYDNDYQLLQGFNTIDVSVPPPNYHTNTQVNTDRPLVDISQTEYAGVMMTGTSGLVPNQSKPKDNPPVKNTPPGVCNYCEKRGHGRQNCRLLKLREQEPHLTWCDRCYMKNHQAIHCTFQVPIHNSHSPNNFNKQPKLDNPQVKYVQYPPKLNSYENHKIRISTNSKFHKREYHIKREITKRLSQLEPNLRTKVLNHYTSDNPKNNFIICPHSIVQNNHECYYCQNSHPELLKLEKSIASFNSSFVANNSVNNNTQQHLNPLPTNNQFEVLKNKVSLNVNNKGSKVNKKSKVNSKNKAKNLKQPKEPRKTAYQVYQDNKQNRNNHKQHDIAIKNEAPQKELPKQTNPIKQLENKFNPSWTKELDKNCEGQYIKMFTGHTLLRSVHNNNAFGGGDSTLINSLHTPYPHMFGILNKTRRIQVTNESFNTPTTVRNVTPNQFWVNVNNVFIYSLVDSGAEHSSIRQDIVEKLNLEMLPLNEAERKFSVGLAGKIPILGTVYVRINLTDVELNTHRFKVVPKISEDTDELVLGQDFLISKELIYCGDRRILRGYYANDIIWTY